MKGNVVLPVLIAAVQVGLPSSGAGCLDVRDFGAVGDGVSSDTRSLQRAIDSCPPGGTVCISPGVYLSGALWLKSDMTLVVCRGATLQGSASADDYPVWDWWFEGCAAEPCYASLLNVPVAGVSNLVIRGEGVIDGNGEKLVVAEEQIGRKGKRGRVLGVSNSRNVVVEGVTFRQSASWCLHFIYCEDVVISNVTVRTKEDEHGRRYRGVHNGDGIDIDSSLRVRVEGCHIYSQDDCIAIKSGKNAFGREMARPTEDVLIRNCFFGSGFGVAVGSEMSGDVRRVDVRDCVFSNSFSLASIKSVRGRGGIVEDVCFENIRFVNRSQEVKDTKWYRGGIYLDMFYSVEKPKNGEWMAPNEGTPRFRRIAFRNIDAETVVSSAIYAAGLPESCIEGLVFDHVRARGRWGMLAANLRDVRMTDCEIAMEEGDRFRLENVINLSWTR